MKIQCDVCEKAAATLICCADEAALCAKCDVEVHAANKLASKHQRLVLQNLSNKLPPCDICQEKPAFIFCVEDRALFCQDCDEPIHSAGSLAANHQRFLATGIRVALKSKVPDEVEKMQLEPPPPSKKAQQIAAKSPAQQSSAINSPTWEFDDLLHFSDFDSSDKNSDSISQTLQKEQLEFGELDWFTGIGAFGEQVAQKASAAAEVPQLPSYQSSNSNSYWPTKYYMPSSKKPRLEFQDDDDDGHFTVPDLG